MKKVITVSMVFVLVLSSVFSANVPLNQTSSLFGGNNDRISRDMKTLERLYRYIDDKFLYEIDYDKVYDAMATAMVDALEDPWSYYVGKDESDEYGETTSGSFGGIGIYLTKKNPKNADPEKPRDIYVEVASCFPGASAERAGLRTGDLITAIDGESVVSKTSSECSKMIKGTPGTKITLTIKRGETVFDVSLTREKVKTPTVDSCVLDGNIGYIKISEFSPYTGQQTTEALSKINAPGLKALIIDLRSNHGGDVSACLATADLFITNSKLLNVVYKNDEGNVYYKATGNLAVPESVPMAVLINGGSASAAEILSGAFQDSGRAKIFGSKSYGKGVMQIVTPFGTGYLSVTNSEYRTPLNNKVNEVGITPDFEVEELEFTDAELESYEKLLNENVISEFVNKNPALNDGNLKKFCREQADCGIRSEILTILVRNEYIARMDSANRPIADPKYDNTLRRAVEYLKTGK